MPLVRAALGHSLQLSLDGPRTGKHLPVHFIETVVRGIKHEAAWNADSDPDRATVELDRKSLGNHGTLLPACTAGPGRDFASKVCGGSPD